MSALIQIISVTTYSLSIAIVVQSKKKKYHLQDFANRGSLTLLRFICPANTNYFYSIRIGTVTFDHYNSSKNNFITTLRLAKNSYFQRIFTECSNNSRGTWKTLNCLIRCRNTSTDVTLNHNGSSISDPSAIALPNYLMTIFQTLPTIFIAVFLIQILLRCIS